MLNCFLGSPFSADEEHYLLVHFLDGRTALENGPAFRRFKSWEHR